MTRHSDEASAATTLANYPIGLAARIIHIELPETLRERFDALGIYRGAQVIVLRRAPFGGPLHLRLHTGELAIRNAQAQSIVVAPATMDAESETRD